MRLDAGWLYQCGFPPLDADEVDFLLAGVAKELEVRVGHRIGDMLTSDQIDEFDAVTEGGSQADALAWLEEHVPTYRSAVAAELSAMERDIRRWLLHEGLHARNASVPSRRARN